MSHPVNAPGLDSSPIASKGATGSGDNMEEGDPVPEEQDEGWAVPLEKNLGTKEPMFMCGKPTARPSGPSACIDGETTDATSPGSPVGTTEPAGAADTGKLWEEGS